MTISGARLTVEGLPGRYSVAQLDRPTLVICHIRVLSRLARQDGDGERSLAALDPQHDLVAGVVLGVGRERDRRSDVLLDDGAVVEPWDDGD